MSLSRPSKNFSTNSSYHNFPRSEICGAHTPVSNSIIKSKSLSSGLLYCYAVSIIVTWNNTLRFFIANCLKGMVKAKYNSQFCVHLWVSLFTWRQYQTQFSDGEFFFRSSLCCKHGDWWDINFHIYDTAGSSSPFRKLSQGWETCM